MFSSTLLLPLTLLAPVPTEASLLTMVPGGAYTLVHCRDLTALRARAERNDWYRLLGSSHGEPLLGELTREFSLQTHSEADELMALARALQGEVVFFATETVGGLVAEPPTDRAALADAMKDWMPEGDPATRQTLELAGGAVHLAAWPDEPDSWSGRAGHFAAFVDHPRALAILSGDDKAALMAALTECMTRLGAERRAPLVESYLASGGGVGGGVEFFIDFTPLIGQAEAALKDAFEGMLPDPSSLLGLEAGTWLHASADVFPGTRVDCQARLRLPSDTLSAQLADTFKPLPHTLPADLPKGVWGLWALNWDLKLFYQRVRTAFEDSGRGDGLAVVDAGIGMAQGMAGVDPIVDVLNQLEGNFAFYLADPPSVDGEERLGDEERLLSIGFQAGLVDGDTFLTAFEKLIGVGQLEDEFTFEEIAGADAYLLAENDYFEGGFAFLPRAFIIGLSRNVLERSLQALTRAEDASLLDGSRMQAAIDENAGACFLMCVEMTPLRAFMELEGELNLPPLEAGQPARDPFDCQLISTARRTGDGFEFRLQTR